ncbi:hypothetical protein [Nocardiopsis salina]|uniref:hypothetical protein n=1 Tax=Nocardiopsis salina TaxID=245836 RepID=UPI0003773DD3|nr:hypothetical protein [Nocardiopsis salina]
MRDDRETRPILGHTVTAADLYGELRQLSGQLQTSITHQEVTRTQLRDHEQRIRALEAWRYALPVSAFSAVAAAIAAIISAFMG